MRTALAAAALAVVALPAQAQPAAAWLEQSLLDAMKVCLEWRMRDFAEGPNTSVIQDAKIGETIGPVLGQRFMSEDPGVAWYERPTVEGHVYIAASPKAQACRIVTMDTDAQSEVAALMAQVAPGQPAPAADGKPHGYSSAGE